LEDVGLLKKGGPKKKRVGRKLGTLSRIKTKMVTVFLGKKDARETTIEEREEET